MNANNHQENHGESSSPHPEDFGQFQGSTQFGKPDILPNLPRHESSLEIEREGGVVASETGNSIGDRHLAQEEVQRKTMFHKVFLLRNGYS